MFLPTIKQLLTCSSKVLLLSLFMLLSSCGGGGMSGGLTGNGDVHGAGISVGTVSGTGARTPQVVGNFVTSCGIINSPGTYVLQNDVSSTGSCFFIGANNVTLDLNGHTITYDNAAPITVANGSFESALSGTWDTTSAVNASRFVGSFLASTVYDGTYSLKVATPTADQVIKQTGTITLQTNTTYSISGMYYNQVADTVSVEIGLLDTNDQVITGSNKIISNRTYRGSQFFNATYATGASTVTGKVYLKVSNAGAAPVGVVYFDDIKVQRHLVHGIQIGRGISISNTHHATDEPNGLSDVSGTIVTSSVSGGKILQGSDNGTYSDAIFVPGNSGTNFVIENIDITVQGANARPMTLDKCENANVRTNVIHHNTTTVTSRDNTDGASIFVSFASNGSKIYGNTITSSPQAGIVFSKSVVGSTLNQIYGNTITMQTKYTNDFAIWVTNALVHDNIIDCSSGNNSCRGIHIGVSTNISDGGAVYNNTISVQELARNQEYAGCELYGAYGIQIEDNTKNLEIYGNTVTAYAGECQAHAMRPAAEAIQSGNYMHNNIFTAITTGANIASSIFFEGGTDSLYTIINNTFVTNSRWIKTGDSNFNMTMTGNRWETSGTLNTPFHPFEINPYDSVTGQNTLTAITKFNGNTYGTGDQARFTGECWRSTYAMGACLAGSSITILP